MSVGVGVGREWVVGVRGGVVRSGQLQDPGGQAQRGKVQEGRHLLGVLFLQNIALTG